MLQNLAPEPPSRTVLRNWKRLVRNLASAPKPSRTSLQSSGEVPERGSERSEVFWRGSGAVPEQGSGAVPERFGSKVLEKFRSKVLEKETERDSREVVEQGCGEVPERSGERFRNGLAPSMGRSDLL